MRLIFKKKMSLVIFDRQTFLVFKRPRNKSEQLHFGVFNWHENIEGRFYYYGLPSLASYCIQKSKMGKQTYPQIFLSCGASTWRHSSTPPFTPGARADHDKARRGRIPCRDIISAREC